MANYRPVLFLSGAIVAPEAARFRRAFAAARNAERSLPPIFDGWRFYILMALLLGNLAWWPFSGETHHDFGRNVYDLATGYGGLFLPYLLMTTVWWGAAFYLWLHLLAAVAAD